MSSLHLNVTYNYNYDNTQANESIQINDYKTTYFVLMPSKSVVETTATASERSTGIEVMMILQSIIATVGIFANLTVVVVFLNDRKLRRKIPNIFIINQSLLDLAVSIVLLSSTLTIKDQYVIHYTGIWGSIECRLWNTKFLLWAFFIASTYNVVVLTFERYLELVHPFWHKMHFKVRWIYISFSVNVTWCLTFYGAQLISVTKVVSGVCWVYTFWPSLLFSSIFGIILFVIQFFIPLFVFIYCYGRIVWNLSRRIDRNDKNNDRTLQSNQGDKFQLARTNTLKTFFLVALSFVICWSNNQVYYLMHNMGYEVDWNSVYYKFTLLMMFLNCTVNPFIYLAKYRDYQIALKKFLKCVQKQAAESNVLSSHGSSTVLSTMSIE